MRCSHTRVVGLLHFCCEYSIKVLVDIAGAPGEYYCEGQCCGSCQETENEDFVCCGAGEELCGGVSSETYYCCPPGEIVPTLTLTPTLTSTLPLRRTPKP